MPYIADRTQDTTTTTGTGAVTLAGVAPTGYRTFATAFGSSSRVIDYCIDGGTSGEWEVGEGTFNGTTGLTRDRIRASSNSNALVSFASGTKTVFCTAAADLVNNSNSGLQTALNMNWALP